MGFIVNIFTYFSKARRAERERKWREFLECSWKET